MEKEYGYYIGIWGRGPRPLLMLLGSVFNGGVYASCQYLLHNEGNAGGPGLLVVLLM